MEVSNKALIEEQEDLATERQREYANEVEEGRFEAFVRDNREHLEKTFIEINKDDFEEFCRNDYEMFKND